MGKMDKRVDSYSKLYSEEANARNKSVAWLYDPTARVMYILGIGMTFMATWTITETTIPKVSGGGPDDEAEAREEAARRHSAIWGGAN